MTAPKRDVLALGIFNPQVDPKGEVLEKQREHAATKNLCLNFWPVNVTEQPLEAILRDFRTKLEERPYDIVSIGFGIRGNRDLTPLFEKLVNLALEVQPRVKLAFPSQPDAVIDACERVLETPH